MHFNNLINNDSENWSFTGIVSIWVLFSLFGDSFGFFLIEYFPSKPEYSYLQVLILNILLLSAFPICMIGLVSNFLPYQAIDYSLPAIIRSLEHKLLFLCTSPILYLGYQLANKIGSLTDSLIEPGFGFFSTGLVIWLTIFGWIYFSLWCWELFFGEDASITLRKLTRQNNQFGSSTNFSGSSFQPREKNRQNSLWGKISFRYISFMFGFPILIMMLGATLDPKGGFAFGILFSIGLDLFACFFSFLLIKNYLNQKGSSLEFLNHLSLRLFGNKDIDSISFFIGIFFIINIFLFALSFQNFIPKVVFIMLYFLLFLILISMIWSNQIKAFFYHLRPF